MLSKLLLAVLSFVVLAASAVAQPLADPRVPWFSADSANFRVHYRGGQRAQAEAVARAAERVHGPVTQALNWVPRTRTEIVVYSEFDIANGFATPLPSNFMGVFLAPPDEGELLSNAPWLDLLLVHEYTHAVHLDKVRGAPAVLQRIFGNVPWFIPNVFAPGWFTEGLAVQAESDPAAGRGRLMGPAFEAWLRAERARGFVSLRELNADGRRLPLAKQYLYGAYFMDFLRRRHGADAPAKVVERYSGNLIFPRLHSAPWEATGQTMDTLWDAFLADLAQQVDARAAPLKAAPEVLGTALGGPLFELDSPVPHPQGGWLAVLGDGLQGTHLVRIAADGARERIVRVNRGARVSVGADGTVLVAQPDICRQLYYTYDIHRLDGRRLQPVSTCQSLRRAVPAAGGTVFALHLVDGATRLVRLSPQGTPAQVLLAPEDGSELLDLAVSPDGRELAVVSRRGGDWRVLALPVEGPAGAAPRVLVRQGMPLSSLRWGAGGLTLVMAERRAEAVAANVWRLAGERPDRLERLTHAHTGVAASAGLGADGALGVVAVAPGGYALHRLPQPAALAQREALDPALGAAQEVPMASGGAAGASAAPTATAVLQAEQPYASIRAARPRSWMPYLLADRGLTVYGASTGGGDPLGWHRYLATAGWETSQKEPVLALEYQFASSHGLAYTRELVARAWRIGSGGGETTTVYDRRQTLQWLSTFPFSRIERGITLGVGAAADWVDRVDLNQGLTRRRQDERLLAGLLDLDFSGSDWFSEGPNRGWRATLLLEGYKPLAGGDARRYDGTVARADLRGYVPLGRSVLAARYTEARANGRTEPFQLGGASDDLLQLGPVLNDRSLALRGYRGDEPGLRGASARVASLEWRTPLADIDRHFMVPAVGINRLSASVFADAGGAWSTGSGPTEWQRGVGVELLAEVKLLYSLGLQLRLGVARGLDGAKDTRGYLTAGRSF